MPKITDEELRIINHTASNQVRTMMIAYCAGKYGFDSPRNIFVDAETGEIEQANIHLIDP